MPAIPAIMAVTGIIGGINQTKQAERQSDQNQSQVDLQKQQWDYQKQQDAAKKAAADKYWNEYNSSPTTTYQDEISRATSELTPLYDEQSKKVINDLGTSQMARGFYGQLPGDVQTQDAIAKLETNKNQAITGQANKTYQDVLSKKLAEKQLGLSTFGTY